MIKKFLITILIMILGLHIPAIEFDWYYALNWFDIPMHILGGLWVGFLFFYIIEKNQELKNVFLKSFKNILIFSILTLGFIILIGLGWELYEFTVDVLILKKYPYNLEPGHILFDTLLDFINDLIGGIIALIIYYKINFKKK
ncbi:MAG: hypothetical protein NZ484_01425 [Patescibacteria group bacterium]|nr:hypothetical protein [Patescibacteria group bacterium]MDW8279844.1 hypothetical protein [bacterium]